MEGIRLSGWIVVHDYCATRVLAGTDPEAVSNRRGGNPEADGTYGFDSRSRAWCDQRLVALGYVVPDAVDAWRQRWT